MRQAGILAAAAKLALTEQIAQLSIDHDNAQRLAQGLVTVNGFSLNPDHVQTNLVFAKIDPSIDVVDLAKKLAERGILVSPANPMRFATHKDITSQDVDKLISTLTTLCKC
jgi:threonine aldolase